MIIQELIDSGWKLHLPITTYLYKTVEGEYKLEYCDGHLEIEYGYWDKLTRSFEVYTRFNGRCPDTETLLLIIKLIM